MQWTWELRRCFSMHWPNSWSGVICGHIWAQFSLNTAGGAMRSKPAWPNICPSMSAGGMLNNVAGSEESGLRLTFCAEPPARLIEGARRLGKAWAAVERRGRGQGSVVEGTRLEVV